MPLSQAQAEDIGKRYTAAWCAHDADAVASFYAADGRIIINDGDPSDGRAAVAEMAQGFFDEFPDLVVRMDSIRTSGTYCIYVWSLDGTHAESGNRVDIGGWEYWRLDGDGSVAESRGHFNAEDYERQLAGG